MTGHQRKRGRLVLATRNQGKVEEIKALLHDLPLEIISLDQLAVIPEVKEDQHTFSGNALKKARAVAAACGLPSLADDSGLTVDALGGRPGVFSSRYAGPGADDAANNRLLLAELKGVPPEKRGAAFVCALALVIPGGETYLIEESCRGRIVETPQGQNGFGYDPLFFYEPAGQTFAQMETALKNQVSHRGKALRRLKKLLESMLLNRPSANG
ncbi:MAG: XTP/dITP diphosphatase [Firmicutes bacterium]|jgi:XTP/dITP diphosphohydrolase|nr:XTP/dITP diphosphatase [Bacillota bacterium]